MSTRLQTNLSIGYQTSCQQARNQLGTSGGAKTFRRGPNF